MVTASVPITVIVSFEAPPINVTSPFSLVSTIRSPSLKRRVSISDSISIPKFVAEFRSVTVSWPSAATAKVKSAWLPLKTEISTPSPPTIVSSPVPPAIMSSSTPPSSWSAPSAPVNTSWPVPPLMTSAPAPPSIVSSPERPKSVSSPEPPSITSDPSAPWSVSSPPNPLRVMASTPTTTMTSSTALPPVNVTSPSSVVDTAISPSLKRSVSTPEITSTPIFEVVFKSVSVSSPMSETEKVKSFCIPPIMTVSLPSPPTMRSSPEPAVISSSPTPPSR